MISFDQEQSDNWKLTQVDFKMIGFSVVCAIYPAVNRKSVCRLTDGMKSDLGELNQIKIKL